MRLNLLSAAILVVLALTLPGIAVAQTPTPTTVTPPVPLAGKTLYAQNCAPCHGNTGQGDGASASGLSVAPAALGNADLIFGKSLTELFNITKNGNMQRMMPPWKNQLTDQQIWDTLGYAWTLHTTDAELRAGKTVYDATCAACHGADGRGASANVPSLADFAATSQVSQAAWAKVVANGRGAMPGLAGQLTAAEQKSALEYARSLSFGGSLFRDVLAKGTGVISGTVTNGTTGSKMADLEVELGIFDSTSLLEQRTTRTDAAGFYRFTELPTDPTLIFASRVVYPAGTPYSSDFVSFEGGKEGIDLPMTVYETTTDGTGVRAERVHFIVEFAGGNAQVAELLVFSLDGDRAYVGDGSAVLRFTLPAGAQNLSIDGADDAGRFEVTADGFVDKLGLPPGQNTRQVLYRYSLPYADGKLDIVRSLAYPATNVNALVSDIGQQVSSEQLASLGVRETQMGNYYNLSAQNVPAGQAITLRMTGLSTTAAGATTTGATGGTGSSVPRPLLFGLIGLAAAGAAALVLLPLLRGRATPRAGAPTQREALIDALAQLDLAFEAGDLTESAYRDQRLQLKAQLSDILRKEAL